MATKKPTKREADGKDYFASDYAYAPSDNASQWKLRLTATPGGRPDAGIVGAACAALGKGFRGQKVQIPAKDLPAVKAKVRAAWKKANPDKKADEMPDAIAESADSRESTTPGDSAGNVLQEYADNRGQVLKVNRESSTIPGVKLLGTVSAKGREYPPAVIRQAIPLYEGRAVNVDHVEPGGRRSYRDRIGCLKNVQLREDGLYGTLHFNPKHVLAEQLIWDAENAPQNVGFSHDARGPSKLKGGRQVVESIDKVLSVDLVANPATTSGLFEDSFVEGVIADKISADQQRSDFCTLCCSAMDMIRTAMYDTDAALPAVTRKILGVIADWQKELTEPTPPEGSGDSTTQESREMELKDLTLADLKQERPDLLTALQEDLAPGDAAKAAANQLKTLQEELTALTAEKQARVLQETIEGELRAAKFDPADKTAVSDVFWGLLREAKDADARKRIIDDRAKTLQEARTRTHTGPVTTAPAGTGGVPTDPREFRRRLVG
jgi:hypothetical protein